MRKRGLGSGFGGLIAPAPTEQAALQEVSVAAIVPNPHQPRAVFDPAALDELTESIKQHGILQPLVVTRLSSGDYQLIAGERRLRAARQAGLDAVPVVIKEASAQQQLELALIENIQRADLDPIEEARAYAMLEDQFGLKHGEIAQRVGKSRSTISETLGLLKLPLEVQEMVSAGRLTPGHANILVGLRDPQKEIAAARHIAEQGLSVRRTEQYIAQLSMADGRELASSKKHQPNRATPEDESVVRTLEEHLNGVRVQLVRTGRGGRLVIHFDDEEMLSGLYDRLMGL
ncbi:MAG TPA: ParB/RepB/Spo0J family partition protein [Herpetosiphonaceae bacterium]